jgi:putative multiple sugar transport system substrate-binding protein
MKRLIGILLVLLLILTFVACNNRNGTSSEKEVLIGISMPNKATKRWITEGELMRDSLNAKGYQVDLQYSENNVNDQVNQVENMISKGAKLLIIAAVDGSSMTTNLENAAEQGAKVIAYERLLMNSGNVDYYCTFDNFIVGADQAKYIVDKLDLDNTDKSFTIEIFAGSLDDSVAHYNYAGSMSVLQSYIDSGKLIVKSGQTEINKVATQSWAAEAAQARMDNLLSGYYADEDLDAVLCPYDGMSIGIVSSLTAVGYGSGNKPMPIVTGQDGEIPSLKSILAGGQTMTVYKNVRSLAEKGVEMALSILEGKEVEISDRETYNNGSKIVPAYLVPPVIVDAHNLQSALVDSGLVEASELR